MKNKYFFNLYDNMRMYVHMPIYHVNYFKLFKNKNNINENLYKINLSSTV